MSKKIEIGPYSAYAIAVKHGYVGTEEDWIKAVEAARKNAETSASAAKSAAETATSQTTEAANQASAASFSAKAAAASQTAAKASETESAKNLQGTREYYEQVRTITIGAQGWYATPEALKAAVPIGENGWWAVVGTTDTIWTWDGDTNSWKDSIQKADLSDYYTKAQADAKFGTPYTLPAATASRLGGVKVGEGLDVDEDGTLHTSESAAGDTMTGATSTAAGKAGLVPAPAAGEQEKYLRGDGAWQTPTNTNTWRGIQNNLTSTSTQDSLSAYQGKVLKDLVDEKAESNHTHNYAGAGSPGGTALSVNGFTIRAQTTDPGAGSYLTNGAVLLVYA